MLKLNNVHFNSYLLHNRYDYLLINLILKYLGTLPECLKTK